MGRRANQFCYLILALLFLIILFIHYTWIQWSLASLKKKDLGRGSSYFHLTRGSLGSFLFWSAVLRAVWVCVTSLGLWHHSCLAALSSMCIWGPKNSTHSLPGSKDQSMLDLISLSPNFVIWAHELKSSSPIQQFLNKWAANLFWPIKLNTINEFLAGMLIFINFFPNGLLQKTTKC